MLYNESLSQHNNNRQSRRVLGMVVPSCNPHPPEVGAERSGVLGQPWLRVKGPWAMSDPISVEGKYSAQPPISHWL